MAQDTRRQDSSMNKDFNKNASDRDRDSSNRDSRRDSSTPSTDKKEAGLRNEKFNKR